jgi:hypothetical protein
MSPSRYFFHVKDGHDLPDETGMLFPSAVEARQEAIETAGELLRGDGAELWTGSEWMLRVIDEIGTPVFTIKIIMDEHGLPNPLSEPLAK